MDGSELNQGVPAAFAYNLQNIMNFILQDSIGEKGNEIHETYTREPGETAIHLTSKILSEVKNNTSLSPIASLRYDLIMKLIDQINTISMVNTDEIEGMEDEDVDEIDVDIEKATPYIENLGQTIALNTMLNEELITTVNFKNLISNE